jgi:hypothetical protein
MLTILRFEPTADDLFKRQLFVGYIVLVKAEYLCSDAKYG